MISVIRRELWKWPGSWNFFLCHKSFVAKTHCLLWFTQIFSRSKFWVEVTLETGGVEGGDISDDEQVEGDELVEVVEEEPELLWEEMLSMRWAKFCQTTDLKKLSIRWYLDYCATLKLVWQISPSKFNAQKKCWPCQLNLFYSRSSFIPPHDEVFYNAVWLWYVWWSLT